MYRKQASRFIDANKIISVDGNFLNYSSFYPNKMLGSNLSVGNMSDAEQIVELSIDSNNREYDLNEICARFDNPDLPFTYSQSTEQTVKANVQTERIENSETKYGSWFIENPISKELTKRITLKLGPKAE